MHASQDTPAEAVNGCESQLVLHDCNDVVQAGGAGGAPALLSQLDARLRAFQNETFRHVPEAAVHSLQSSSSLRGFDPSPPWLSVLKGSSQFSTDALKLREVQLLLFDAVLSTAADLKRHEVCLSSVIGDRSIFVGCMV